MRSIWPKYELLLLLLILFIGLSACTTNHRPTPISLAEPATFVKMAIPEDNPFTQEGIELGRYLFYDPILSEDQTISCASCHQQALAFTDAKGKSIGIRGAEGNRSAMPLFNVGYYHKGLFWDGRIKSLEQQVHFPINDTLEMGANWLLILGRIRKHPTYPQLFEQAFNIATTQIDSNHIMKALAQFQRTLISSDSKYDRVQRGEAAFSASEKRGWTIFFDAAENKELPFSECGHCHLDPLFTTQEYMNNGIEQVANLESFPDMGRGAVSGIKFDNGKFRIPSLRNIALTAPYMHDGRFQTLEEVIDHYVTGGHFADNVNPNVQKLHFSEQDKADVIAFLKTLTDTVFVNNPAYASPF